MTVKFNSPLTPKEANYITDKEIMETEDKDKQSELFGRPCTDCVHFVHSVYQENGVYVAKGGLCHVVAGFIEYWGTCSHYARHIIEENSINEGGLNE